MKTQENDQVFLVPEGEIKKDRDYNLISLCGIVTVLVVIGFINLYSADVDKTYFYNQLLRSFMGIVVFVVVGWWIPVRNFNSYTYWIYGFVCVLLLCTLFLGHSAGGAQRWLNLGFFKLQPSEFAKIISAIITAHFFYSYPLKEGYKLSDMKILIGMLALLFIIIFRQPDLGTAGVCMLIVGIQLFFININKISLIRVGLGALLVLVIAWNFLLHNYQKLRILNLLNPNLDPFGSGYNSIQSIVAAGSGGFWGKGHMSGTQTQLAFLPAKHTDFIFSVFTEEHGFLGSMVVILLFMWMLKICINISKKGIDTFSSLLVIGLAANIFISVIINIAMVLGLFPVVGIPLPFFSYGGSSTLASFLTLGLIVAVHRQSQGAEFKKLGRKISVIPVKN